MEHIQNNNFDFVKEYQSFDLVRLIEENEFSQIEKFLNIVKTIGENNLFNNVKKHVFLSMEDQDKDGVFNDKYEFYNSVLMEKIFDIMDGILYDAFVENRSESSMIDLEDGGSTMMMENISSFMRDSSLTDMEDSIENSIDDQEFPVKILTMIKNIYGNKITEKFMIKTLFVSLFFESTAKNRLGSLFPLMKEICSFESKKTLLTFFFSDIFFDDTKADEQNAEFQNAIQSLDLTSFEQQEIIASRQATFTKYKN